ncbi:Cytochrome c oxidase assembly protein COX20, mitochondrial [Pseudolycoriella hygida]|uniref:Cytochrome c oxidase assembly protein COX20, mitochondrial n=1 Tax=Pseudolycoriella hygida TaxID=35572 RepID=A0A9Q0S8Q1_9DIPT|nr:Cytochrome c oxidase assembly protein COX20, mitochondrial [Pseudolycoriella hygida]
MDPETQIEDAPDKSLYIFGRDVSKIPCFRNSFLYGMTTGIGVSVGTFMFTSRPQLGMHVGMASFTLTTLFYWFHCRYNFSKAQFEYAKIRKHMKDATIYEGTEVEEALKNSAESV